MQPVNLLFTIHYSSFIIKLASYISMRLHLAGVQGFEPRKCLSQSQVPYRLATPQYISSL